MKFFLKTHEWVDDLGVVGISKYALKELGDIIYIELPEVGAFYEAEEKFCVVESTKAATDLYLPLSGKILSVNQDFLNDPTWIVKLKLEDPIKVSSLLNEKQYSDLIEAKF
jgi:glycine cleavage system H protein